MKKIIPFVILFFAISILSSCDKEKIVTTTETEYVQEIQYIELPPDTIQVVDTLFLSDSVTVIATDTLIVNNTDTLFVNTTDTIIQTETVVDTIEVVHNNYDTVTVINTVTVTDTIVQIESNPDAYYAYSALQYHTNPGVLEFINTEFGFTDGWIFYLTSFQNDITNPSAGVFEFYGFIDYWTPDWSSYYPLEYLWRVTYTGGDPSNPQNWQLTDPPSAVNGNSGGISLKTDRTNTVLK